jgi:hypothetical protein
MIIKYYIRQNGMTVHSNFVDENVMRSVALYRKQIGQNWRYIQV